MKTRLVSPYISVVSAGKWVGMVVSFLFLQSAIPSEHLHWGGQVQEAEGEHSDKSSSSSSSAKNGNHKIH